MTTNEIRVSATVQRIFNSSDEIAQPTDIWRVFAHARGALIIHILILSIVLPISRTKGNDHMLRVITHEVTSAFLHSLCSFVLIVIKSIPRFIINWQRSANELS